MQRHFRAIPVHGGQGHLKETRVGEVLSSASIEYIHEYIVPFQNLGGTFARLDFAIFRDGVHVFVECDEDQHGVSNTFTYPVESELHCMERVT